MTPLVNSGTLAPLLAIARNDPDAAVRCAALDVASRLPLTEEAWRALWSALRQVVDSLGRETLERAAALAVAVRIPLLSVRRELRTLAEDPGEPAAGALAEALASAGDRSQIGRLLNEANAGRWAALERLAAIPLEQEGITPSRIPSPPATDHPEARMWYALAMARLGEFRAIDAFLAGGEPEPPIFYGAPGTPYARIAAMRPLPSALHAHLCEALAWADHVDDPARARMARIIVWAATGSADAEGEPIHLAKLNGIGAPLSPGATAPDEAFAAAREFFQRSVSQATTTDLVLEPGIKISQFIAQVIGEANRKVAELPPDVPANQFLGNQVIEILRLLPRTEDWPVAAVIAIQLGTPRAAFDDGQIAWVIAQAPGRRMISELSALFIPQRSRTERLRIFEIAATAADYQSGRGGSPYRGAAGGHLGGPPARRGALIDDEKLLPSVDELDRWDDELRIGGPTTARREVDDRRVHAVILQGGQTRRVFVTGVDNVIRCWIGLPEREAAFADKSIPAVAIPPEGLPLLVQLYWRDGSGGDHTDSKPMLLPSGRTARSGDCDLHVYVPEGERYVSIEIMFRYRGRVFEMVRVEAYVLAPDEVEGPQHEILVRVQASRREVIEMPDSQSVGAMFVFGDGRPGSSHDLAHPASSSLRVFGREGVTNFDLSDASEAVRWLNETLSATEKLVVRRRAVPAPAGTVGLSTPLPQDLLDTEDPDVCRLLRDMARHGAALYNKLTAEGFVDPGERIQVLNHEPTTYVPLEFVYDRGYPVSKAKVCAAGLEAVRSDAAACPVCAVPASDEERATAAVICPYGFWSIRKVIERVVPGVSCKASTPRIERRGLPVLDSVAFASSHLVPHVERKKTQEALLRSFDRVFLAEDWNQWREAMRERPSVLLLMPHHGIQAKLDYLEIGEEHLPEDLGKLSRAQLLRQYVNFDGRDPGPIVLLLGCQTAARTETGYVQITQLIQEQHASIVLGTLAEILGRHAAPMARELVAELVTITDPQIDFGTVMRRVRRRMLARGYLMALCLVALGDAEWRLTPRPDFGRRDVPGEDTCCA
jgi:hypothetical protein